MRNLRRQLVVAGVLISLGRWSHALEVVDIVKRNQDAIVLVATYGVDGKPKGIGSGFIVFSTGVVVTNRHVVADAGRLVVQLSNGAYLPVNDVRTDEQHDLALLYLEAQKLPAVALGNSENLLVGERVVAIGHPQGLVNSVSEGIVSAFRETKSGRKIIQTTAAVSPGSSGGPLFNQNGEVIGIVVSTLRSGQSLNFAIPVNDLRGVLARPEPRSLEKLFEGIPKKSTSKDQARNRSSKGPVAKKESAIDRGMREALSGNLDRAKETFRNEVSREGRNSDAWAYLGYVYYLQGQMDEARLAYEPVIREMNEFFMKPHETRDTVAVSDCRPFLPSIREKLGPGGWRVAAATSAAKVYPEDVGARFLASALSLSHEFSVSEAYVASSPVMLANAEAHRAIIRAGLSEMENLVSRLPLGSASRFFVLQVLGEAYLRAGDYEKARVAYRRFTEEFTNDPVSHYLSARALIKTGDGDLAREALRKASEIVDAYAESPPPTYVFGNFEFMRLVGETYCLLGDKGRAKEQYEKLGRLAADYESRAGVLDSKEPTEDDPNPSYGAVTLRGNAGVARNEARSLLKVIFP